MPEATQPQGTPQDDFVVFVKTRLVNESDKPEARIAKNGNVTFNRAQTKLFPADMKYAEVAVSAARKLIRVRKADKGVKFTRTDTGRGEIGIAAPCRDGGMPFLGKSEKGEALLLAEAKTVPVRQEGDAWYFNV